MSVVLQSTPAGPVRPVEFLSVVYSSIAAVPFTEVDLALLLATSRMNNEAKSITGVLLHRDGHFMQALEGPVGAVRSVLRTIAADERHRDVRILDEEYLVGRRFGSWSMGYRPLTETDLAEAPAWFGSPEAARGVGDFRAAELLAWFRGR
ncbi:BLUF domain-containing protein [Amnibacterium kyonggiense]|uniref:FAD-dependent sensor of blue light n=1 Tax=Amnibacterium kyonggiense TaxID=595671 RepID=A0A4R7FPD5_9MICO|nr:BLUF domain-containing protein [Amnibacterium kyonggiense]TDS79607.1 FAD-dependent sensor of blue light [Amnibacterium kyonggiense]